MAPNIFKKDLVRQSHGLLGGLVACLARWERLRTTLVLGKKVNPGSFAVH